MSAAEALMADDDPLPSDPLTPAQAQKVADNLGLISIVVKPGRLDYEDAFQDGVLGLMRASQKFDPSKGFQFSTYSIAWIRQAVGRGLTERSQHGARNQRRAMKNGEVLAAVPSLDAELDEDVRSLGEQIVAPVDVEREALSSTIERELIERISEVARDDKDKAILASLAYGEKATMESVAQVVGLTREAARQRVLKMRGRLRHPTHRACHGPTDG